MIGGDDCMAASFCQSSDWSEGQMIKRWHTQEKLGAEMMSTVKTCRRFWNLEDY